MLFDIAWPELMLIGVIALVVIGPKDLPRALRVAGFWVRKARTLSREFQSSIDQMIREAELEEVREELKKAAEIDIEKEIRNTVDPTGELAESVKPPVLPDYFEEPPVGSAVAASEPAPALSASPEAAAPTSEGAPGSTEVPETAPKSAVAVPGTSEHAAGAPAPEHEPASPKP